MTFASGEILTAAHLNAAILAANPRRQVSGLIDTPTSADIGGTITYTANAPVTVTCNDLGVACFYRIVQQGTGQVTLRAGTGATLVSPVSPAQLATSGRGSAINVSTDGVGNVYVSGQTAVSTATSLPGVTKAITFAEIGDVVAGVTYTGHGSLDGYATAPALELSKDGGATWAALPGGGSVTSTTFSFQSVSTFLGVHDYQVRDVAGAPVSNVVHFNVTAAATTTSAPVSAMTWDPADCSSGVALSDGNRTYTWNGNSDGFGGVRGTIAIPTTQPSYFELENISGFFAGSAFEVGLATKALVLGDQNNDQLNGTTAADNVAGKITCHWDKIIQLNGYWISQPNGGAYDRVNQFLQGYAGRDSTPGTLGVAYNPISKKIWFRSSLTGYWNDDVAQDPAQAIGGIDVSGVKSGALFAYACNGSGTGSTCLINGGSTPFKWAAPTGFIAIDHVTSTTTGSGSSGVAPTPITPPVTGGVLARPASQLLGFSHYEGVQNASSTFADTVQRYFSAMGVAYKYKYVSINRDTISQIYWDSTGIFDAGWATANAAILRNNNVQCIMNGILRGNNDPHSIYQDIASGLHDDIWVKTANGAKAAGVKELVFRPTVEFNGTYQSDNFDDAPTFDIWLAAYRRVCDALHSTNTSSFKVLTSWCPNYQNFNANSGCDLRRLYPGDSYVDIISLDIYNNFYLTEGPPYPIWNADGSFSGSFTSSLTAWMNNPDNRKKFWTEPGAKSWSPNDEGNYSHRTDGKGGNVAYSEDGKGGTGWGIRKHIAFCLQTGKKMGFDEVGCGYNQFADPTAGGGYIQNDPIFIPWLYGQIAAAATAGVVPHHLCIFSEDATDSHAEIFLSGTKSQWQYYFGDGNGTP